MRRNFFLKSLVAVVIAGLASVQPALAGERQDLLQLRNTVLNLVDALVKQGVLTKSQASALVKKAEQDAAKQAKAQAVAKSAPAPETEVATTTAESKGVEKMAESAANPKVVRVPYVPEFVKDQIKDQVRKELRGEVLADVEKKAKQEKWGLPEALPAWVSNIKWYGDFRLRDELDSFGSGNAKTLGGNNLYLNIPNVNSAGGISKAGTSAFLNTSQDKNLFRIRMRLGMDAKITDDLKFGMRITTGSQRNPVSTNQTLGNTAQGYSVQLDRAFLQYDRANSEGFKWLTAGLGRIPNPWFSTNLVWDDDLNFEGAAFTLRQDFAHGAAAMEDRPRNAFATFGVFPLQQVNFSSQDKWLAGGQVGVDWGFNEDTRFKMGLAYYDYIHITGKKNALGSTLTNSTAPQFLQKGNLLYNIANDPNLNGGANDQLFALAMDYKLLNITASLDLAQLAPYHVTLTGDIVKNLGYDANQISQRAGGVTYLYPIKDRTLGYQVELVTGWPEISKWGDWQLSAAYKYLQRDAVLDAFTDSDFHLGGTDAQGYILGAKFGLAKNTWFSARWLSATEIDGPPLAIDVLQLDLNTRF